MIHVKTKLTCDRCKREQETEMPLSLLLNGAASVFVAPDQSVWRVTDTLELLCNVCDAEGQREANA